MRRRLGVRRAAGVTTLTITTTVLAAAIAVATPGTGKADDAPGRTGTTPGQTGTLPSQSQAAPGQPGTAPGQSGTAPGRTGTTPGQTGTTPGQTGTTPGQAGTTPADGGTAPGEAGATPGQAGTTPSFAASPRGGDVTVKLPGSNHSVRLAAGMALPSGTVVDATAGSVELPSPGGASPGVFKGGRFVVRQVGGAHPRTDLKLTGGSFAGCPKTGTAAVAASVSARRLGRHSVVNRLWGHDHHGRFSTSGRYAAAVVRGTTWLTEDRCDGTRVAVKQGAVAVRDVKRHRTVVVRAGHSYLVKK